MATVSYGSLNIELQYKEPSLSYVIAVSYISLILRLRLLILLTAKM